MAFKVNISDKGKTLKIEIENENLVGKKIGEILQGEDIAVELAGYELEITGTSDKAGFPGKKDVEGAELKKLLLKKGFGMKKKRKGLRLKKTVRGNTISKDTIQINTIIKKQGNKKFETLLPKKEKEKGEKREKEAEKQEQKETTEQKGKEEQKQEPAEKIEEKQEEKPEIKEEKTEQKEEKKEQAEEKE